MKRTLRKGWACLLLVLVLTLGLGAGSLSEKENHPLWDVVQRWQEAYEGAFGWEAEASPGQAFVPPPDGAIPREEALYIALGFICEDLQVEEDFFAGYRPFIAYSEEGMWVLSILVEEVKQADIPGGIFISVDALAGAVSAYRVGPPIEECMISLDMESKG